MALGLVTVRWKKWLLYPEFRCFCNPGACAKYLGLSHLDILSNIEAGHVCWDDNDIIHGRPTGAVRISFGYMSTYEDAKKFIDFIANSFVSMPNQSGHWDLPSPVSIPFSREGLEKRPSTASFYLKSITIYPIKSCEGFSIERWPLSSTGLQHDREWVLKSLTGEILTQKKVPAMFLISTYIDLDLGILFVKSPHCKEKLQINLNSDSHHGGREEIELNAQRYEVQGYDDEINNWFSNAIGRPCTLLRCYSSKFFLNKSKSAVMRGDMDSRLNFANEAQFLLISEESVSDLNNRLNLSMRKDAHGAPIQISPMRFRPNLIISGGEPYAEDQWTSLQIGKKYFKSIGGCNRCQMINFIQQDGKVLKSNEPLSTLASYRRVKGKILFGILLRYENGNKVGQESQDIDSWLQVRQEVDPKID